MELRYFISVMFVFAVGIVIATANGNFETATAPGQADASFAAADMTTASGGPRRYSRGTRPDAAPVPTDQAAAQPAEPRNARGTRPEIASAEIDDDAAPSPSRSMARGTRPVIAAMSDTDGTDGAMPAHYEAETETASAATQSPELKLAQR